MTAWFSACRFGCRSRAGVVAAVALALVVPLGAVGQSTVAYEIVNAREIPASLTGRPGDPEAGRRLYFDRQLTRCAACHGSPRRPGEQADPAAESAPSLVGLSRRLSEGEIRLWLVAPEVLSPGTTMPAYYALGQRDDPADPRFGEPLLTAQEIEDLVAFLVRSTSGR